VLRFHLLGPFEAWRGDERIPPSAWRTRQTLGVLKVLLDQRDRAVPFDRLADLVWPNSEADAARTSLRGAVRTIRRVLEPELAAADASQYLRTEEEAYRFLPDSCFVDVDAFAMAVKAGAAAERRGDPEAAARAYREAIALYRGDYLVDDAHADWAVERRERLRTTHIDTLERLARLEEDRGAYSEAIGYLDRALIADPLREELYRQLMRSHAAAGRRSHALAVFERCRKLLERELGTRPAPETQRLRDQIARASLETDPQATSAASPALDLAFVGRQAELALLGRAWARAQTESGQVVIIWGRAGLGKTRLAQRFVEHGGQPLRAVWLTVHEAEQDLSFAPLVAMLTSWLNRSATAIQVQRLGPYAPALAHLLPQVRAIWPDCPALPGSGPEPSQLLEAFTQALLLLKGPGPTALIVDDLHWADRSTLLWLGYALRRLEAGVLVVATGRREEPPAESQTQLVAALRRAGRLTEVDLSPLSRLEVGHLVGGRLSEPLYDATGGNPLFLVEILRELERQGQLAGHAGLLELPLPTSIREAIGSRVARLDETSREAVTAVCVLGVPCSASLAARILDRDLEPTLGALDILLQRGLLRTTDGGQEYTAEHPLVRRVVYDELTPGRRQDWHRRTARALEQAHTDYPERTAQQVLRHLLAADVAPDEVIRAGELAGNYALSHHAYSEALFCYQAALDRLSEGDRQADVLRIAERRGQALIGLGRWDEAVACYELILPRVAEPLQRCRVRRNLGMALADRGARGFERALAVLDEAEADLRALDATEPDALIERGRLAGTRAVAHFHRSDFHAMATCARQALHLLEGKVGMEFEVAWLFNRLAVAEQRLGNLQAAEAGFRKAMALAEAIGKSVAEAMFKDNLAVLLMHRGQLARARVMLDAAWQTVRAGGFPPLEPGLLGDRGYLLDYLGDLRGARVSYQAALEKADLIDARFTVVFYSVGLGDVLLRLGEYVQARAVLERAVALGQEIGTRQRVAHAYLHLGDLARHEGDAARGRALAERGLAEGEALSDGYSRRIGNAILARALLGLGDFTAAGAAAERGLEAARAGGFVLDEGRNLVALGQVRWAEGARTQAVSGLERAEEIFRRAGANYLLAETLWARATTVLRTRRQAAAATLDEALSLARAAGAAPLVARIAQARKALATARVPLS